MVLDGDIMKHYKTVVVPATEETTEQKIDKITCDLCKKVIEKDSKFSEEKVTIQYKTGNSFPEGGSGDVTGVDMCPACFEEKLKPWLESHGCELHTVEWDW